MKHLFSDTQHCKQCITDMHKHAHPYTLFSGPALTRLYCTYSIFQLWQQSSLISRSAPLAYTDGWIFIPSHLCANENSFFPEHKRHLTEMEPLIYLYPLPSCKNSFWCFNFVYGQEYDSTCLTRLFSDYLPTYVWWCKPQQHSTKLFEYLEKYFIGLLQSLQQHI